MDKDYVSSNEPNFEQLLLQIEGTAFQVGEGKLLTCWHVCQALDFEAGNAFLMSRSHTGGMTINRHAPVTAIINFIDARTKKNNSCVDAAMLACPVIATDSEPYDVPAVRWGDSARVGVGDRVLIGGFPLGTQLFLAGPTNRAVIQPTFYDGVISAIIPASKQGETRLLQISSVALGGISGGVVCCAKTGKVLGMVTSGMMAGEVCLPITYAIPSEVLRPFAEAVSFVTDSGKIWR